MSKKRGLTSILDNATIIMDKATTSYYTTSKSCKEMRKNSVATYITSRCARLTAVSGNYEVLTSSHMRG